MLHIVFITSWIVTSKEQWTDWAERQDPVDPSMVLMNYSRRELEAKFPEYAVLEATTECGEIYRYRGYPTARQAESIVKRGERRLTINLEHWSHYRTMYGSEAYVRNGVERQLVEMEQTAYQGGHGWESPEAYIAGNTWKCM